MSEAAPRTPQEWRNWSAAYSEQWFRTASEEELQRAGLPSAGLIQPSAGIAAIEQAEARLGTRLPASLRSFYQATDGLLEAGWSGERVLPLAELGWVRETEAETLSDYFYMDDTDELPGLLMRALEIGVGADGDYWFLDPGDDRDGEWAAYAWHTGDGSGPERHDSLADLLNHARATIERLRARLGRPAHPERASGLLAEGRRLALAGDVTAAHETLNRAIDAGSALAEYLDAQVRLFAFPSDWHENTLRGWVLASDPVMAAIDDDHLRGDLIPMFLALLGQARPTANSARWLTQIAPRINAFPGRPADDRDHQAWEAFGTTLAGAPVPDPGPFGRTSAVARELIQNGRPDDAWTVLQGALPSWQPDSPLRVMPVILITDPVLRTIMTPERRLIAAVTRQTP
ncbi:MAG TPA: SMI1/KNR4 family protein [Trebonia sp.]|nr:SMI1/KNR4 family protein [Trebonia sp.]